MNFAEAKDLGEQLQRAVEKVNDLYAEARATGDLVVRLEAFERRSRPLVLEVSIPLAKIGDDGETD